jgi:NO-binding membrane sensor protein with MHYT domain
VAAGIFLTRHIQDGNGTVTDAPSVGAMSMGTGIWSMHFIGMLAFKMPIELGYDLEAIAE